MSVKNYSTAHERLLDGGFADGMLLLQIASIRPGSWQFFILKTHLQKFPLSRLGEIWRSQFQISIALNHNSAPNQLTRLDVKSCGGPIGSLQLLGCCLRCIGESTPITPTNRSTFFCNRGFFFANITNASSNTRYALVTLTVYIRI